MSLPDWLTSQIADRTRAESTPTAAADQMNTCKSIAADLNAAGMDHTADPFWRSGAWGTPDRPGSDPALPAPLRGSFDSSPG